MIATKNFQPFKRRIRFLRFIEGAFAGIAVGSVIGVVWAVLDWRGVYYLEWRQLWALLGVCAIVGACIRVFGRLDDLAVARSIDRRAKLKDRLGTSAEVGGDDGMFNQLLADDATTQLSGLQARNLYPIRVKRMHVLSMAGIGLVAMILFLSNTSIFLPKDALATKEAMQKESKRLEELRKAIFDDPFDKQGTSPELMALQKDLQRLQKDYEKAKIDPKEAMLRAEELAKKADELAKQAGQQSLDKVKQSESVLDKLERSELEKAGLEKADLDSVNMDDSAFDSKMNSAQQKSDAAKSQVDQLKKKLDDLKAQLNKPGLDPQAKKDLENQIKQAEKSLAEAEKTAAQAQKDLESMQLSKEARETLSKIFNDPLWKQIQEEAKKIKQNAQQSAKNGQPKLTKEERLKLQKEMEELLKQLADDDARKEYLEKLLEALKQGGGACQCAGLGFGLGLGIGGAGQGSSSGQGDNGNPDPGPDNDVMIADTGHVRQEDKPIQGKGKGNPIFAPTERDSSRPGLEMTFEIKAPTFKGTKSSVPYQNVLPSYTKKAESALNQNEIPKSQQQRVKRYFESLKK